MTGSRSEIGLDLPLPLQYWRYLMKVLHGDFGISLITSQPVLEDMLRVFPATLELALLALFIGVVFGVPLGVVAATHRGRWQDHVDPLRLADRLFDAGLLARPRRAAAVLRQARLGRGAGPARRVASTTSCRPSPASSPSTACSPATRDVFCNALGHLVLPASHPGLSLARLYRAHDAQLHARPAAPGIHPDRAAKGLSPFRVVWGHALGNIWVPLITVIALTFGSLLEGAVLTETVFAWPGLGLYIKNSLFNADMNAVLGGTVLVGRRLHRPQPALRPALSAGRSARARPPR